MKKIIPILLFSIALYLIHSCKKEFDNPPLKSVSDGAQLSINVLKTRVSKIAGYRFANGDTNLYCTVTADEVSGNIYKQVFVKDDAGGAMQVNLTEKGGLFTGDRIRINLNHVSVVNANEMIYLDSVDVAKNIVKLSSGNAVVPAVASLTAITSQTNAQQAGSLQSQLVQLNGVEFKTNTVNPTYADIVGRASINQVIANCGGQTVTVRTSGYASFANKQLPKGNGSLIAIVSQYNSTMQLTLRSENDVNLTGPTCGGTPPFTGTAYLQKDFNDQSLTSGGWQSSVVSGTVTWSTSNSGETSYYARINNNKSGTWNACENWLISPAIDLSAATSPNLSFRNAYNFTGPALTAWVSTSYSGGLPSTATWTQLNFTLSGGGYAFVNSGNIPLSAYKSTNTRIAFKYTGTSSSGSIWEIDDVLVKEN